MAPLLTAQLSSWDGRPSARDRRDACLSFWTPFACAVHDELRPTVCGSVHDDAAIAQHERSPGAWLSSLARAAMEMSSARRVSVGPCGCCGIVWFCQVGARTCCLRSHQARPEDREALIASPLKSTSSLSTRRSHLTQEILVCGTNPMWLNTYMNINTLSRPYPNS